MFILRPPIFSLLISFTRCSTPIRIYLTHSPLPHRNGDERILVVAHLVIENVGDSSRQQQRHQLANIREALSTLQLLSRPHTKSGTSCSSAKDSSISRSKFKSNTPITFTAPYMLTSPHPHLSLREHLLQELRHVATGGELTRLDGGSRQEAHAGEGFAQVSHQLAHTLVRLLRRLAGTQRALFLQRLQQLVAATRQRLEQTVLHARLHRHKFALFPVQRHRAALTALARSI